MNQQEFQNMINQSQKLFNQNSQSRKDLEDKINSQKRVPDETDVKINQLKNMNSKLVSKMKELNIVLERTLEKANARNISKLNRDSTSQAKDKAH